jgi:methylenetetrahydrofolate dehydrogenase (NADP+)/methenyltetrahydrofolate cyclohydrolase
MTHIFDGKLFAQNKSEILKNKILDLNTKGVFPHLASMLIGDSEASKLYVGLKKKAGEKLGVEVDIYYLPESTKKSDLETLIKLLNEDRGVNGIMIQLPIPGPLSEYKEELINLIDGKKDVDGLRTDSRFVHPTSKAAIDILNFAKQQKEVRDMNLKTVCVVGSTGMVGAPLVTELEKQNYDVIGCDSQTTDLQEKTLKADVVISATGVAGLIKPDMVKENAVVIDIGSPKGDFNPSTSLRASFFTPVPGGVGPVTIISLLENLAESVTN